MKIYQIHRYGGEWDDRFDDVVGTYLDKGRAMEKMAALEKEDECKVEHSHMCMDCPLWDEWSRYDDVVVQKAKEYCADFTKQGGSDSEYKDGFGCINYVGYEENAFYRIEEVEVNE